jgi:hypothetical protein
VAFGGNVGDDSQMISVNEASGAWPVVSRKRDRRRGWCLPILIHNMQFHYTTLFAFEDGVVDCWEGLDLPLFRKKLRNGWIATEAPRGATLSVFGLGMGCVEQFEPLQSLDELEARVLAAIRHWNADPRSWVDLGGEAAMPKGKVRYAKLPALDGIACRHESSGGVRLAREVSVFINRGGSFRLTRWFVYDDGKAKIGPEGPLVELAESEQQVLDGHVTMAIPNGAWVEADGLGRVQIEKGHWKVDAQERIREQRDHLVQLQGGTGAISACRQQWLAYQKTSSAKELERLRERYLAVPRHLRMYCGDMDDKDWPIRLALGMRDGEG